MNCMTVGELLTYLKALPKDTLFPIGLGVPFIINNVTDQLIYKPRLNVTAGIMADDIENSLGKIVRSNTGAQAIINRDGCEAYFGLDAETPLTPLNIIFLTILLGMEKSFLDISVTLNKPGTNDSTLTAKFKVPKTWWYSLSGKHRNVLALEYLTNDVLGGLTFTAAEENIRIQESE